MKILASDLMNRLSELQFGVETRVMQVMQSDCLMFMGDRTYSYSPSGLVVSSLAPGFTGVVNFIEFSRLIKKYADMQADSELQFGPDSEGALVVKCGRSRTRLPFSSSVSLLENQLPEVGGDAWIPLPHGFSDAVRDCESIFPRVAVSDRLLSSIHITSEFMEACSQEHILRRRCLLDVPVSCLVRRGRLSGVLSHSVDAYQFTDRWFVFRSPTAFFFVPLFYDKFIDNLDEKLVPGSWGCEFPKELESQLPIFDMLYRQSKNLFEVSVKDGVCSLSILSLRGQHFVEVPMESDRQFSFVTSPIALHRLLSYGRCTFTTDTAHYVDDRTQYAAYVKGVTA